jgi:hypothetical protein
MSESATPRISDLNRPVHVSPKSKSRGAGIACEARQDRRGVDKGERIVEPERGGEATPRPVLRSRDDSGANWVVDDVPVRGQKGRLVLFSTRPEAVTDQIPDAAVPSVERFRILGIEPTHACRQRFVGHLNESVPVRRELTEAQAPPAVLFEQDQQASDPVDVIDLVPEVGRRAGSVHPYVVKPGSAVTRQARHRPRLAENCPLRKASPLDS